MNYEVEYQDDFLIIKLSGTVRSNERLLSKRSLLSYLQPSYRKVIVDLGELRSGGAGYCVGVLNTIKKEVQLIGGKVEIMVGRSIEEEAVEIIFKDTGIGIFAEDLPKVFDPFQRGQNASGEKGIGLGLSLVKEVVDLHRGEVRVRSEPQKGTTFSIVLPFREGVRRKGGEMAAENFTNI